METKRKTKRIRLYEGMYILSATLSKDARTKAFEKILKGITDKGGEIKKIFEMGKLKFAYEIKNRKEGFYYLIYFTLDSNDLKKLDLEYKLHEDLLRYMNMRTDKVLESLEFKSIKF